MNFKKVLKRYRRETRALLGGARVGIIIAMVVFGIIICIIGNPRGLLLIGAGICVAATYLTSRP